MTDNILNQAKLVDDVIDNINGNYSTVLVHFIKNMYDKFGDGFLYDLRGIADYVEKEKNQIKEHNCDY